jgi:hypothetical protein
MQISTDLIAGLLGFLFTLMILSYIIGDNPFFRLAVHIFVGISAGYVTWIVLEHVVFDKLFRPLIQGDTLERILVLIPLLMSVMLFMKATPRLEFAGRPILAFAVGVGAAAAIYGALMGTIFPQVQASINTFDTSVAQNTGLKAEIMLRGFFVLLGTVATLAYFQFGVRASSASSGKRGMVMQAVAFLGLVFFAITFGVLFAGVYSAAITAMIDRVQSMVNFVASLFF